MKTNEEIVKKIREMMNAEEEKVDEFRDVLSQLDWRDEVEKTNRAKMKWFGHVSALAALVDLEEFATED